MTWSQKVPKEINNLNRCTGISLRANKITEIRNIFQENIVLCELDFAENDIYRVDPKSFMHLKALTTLDLSMNPFTNLPKFEKTERLKTVIFIFLLFKKTF